MTLSPYVVGKWVRGDRFYGRESLIEEAIEGQRDLLWILGTRRIGKTSFLRQLEWIAHHSPERELLPLFWDLQGAADPAELHRSFDEALLDAEDLLDERGIAITDVQSTDLFDSLSRLRRRVRSAGLRLLLLCDEVEELIEVNRIDPVFLRKLRRAFQSKDDIRTVIASTIRLWALAEQKGDTSPFLHGFTPPLYIQRLNEAEARDLVLQVKAPAEHRPAIDDATVDSIRRACDNHPYLLQLLAKRYLESLDLEAAREDLAADEMVSYFFAVDFDMLSGEEKNILHALAGGSIADSAALARHLSIERGELSMHLLRLESLGYVRRSEEGRLEFPSYFLQKWMSQRRSRLVSAAAQPDDGSEGESPIYALATHPFKFDRRYQLVSELGRGATGVVYKAFDEVVRETIAIKIIRPEYSRHPEAMTRLRQEITIARDIGHPNILRVYHLGETRGQYYLTMQLVAGDTLAALVSREGALPVATAVEISAKLSSALEAAHSKRVLHRDIKPQNILMEPSPPGGRPHLEPYLTDFGLARLVDAVGLTESGIFVGTPSYASPEQANLRPLDERSDIYSFGVVMFEMSVGVVPFKADAAVTVLEMHRTASPPDPRSIRPEVPAALSHVILRCLEKDSGRRYQTFTELKSALQEV